MVGAALRRLRDRLDLSLSAVERRSGVSKSYIGQIERGDVDNPGFAMVARICAGLGVTLDDLAVEAGLQQAGPGYRPPEPDEFDRPATRGDVEALRREVRAMMTRRGK